MIGPTSGSISSPTPIGSSGSMMSAKRTAASTPSSSHGHQGDLGAQLGRLGQLQDAVALAELAIGGEAAAGLAHEPDRRRVDRLVPAGPDESVVHARNARRAASSVASTSASPWAIDTNQASNWDGGRRIAAVEHRAEEPA